MLNQLTQETLELLKGIQSGSLSKAVNVATGLVAFDLQPHAKSLYPVITPLRNMIPRVGGGGDTATRWKAITAINPARVAAGVSEGKRGAEIGITVQSYLAAYKGIGLEQSVTFEAQYAAKGFDDAKARAVDALLKSVMIEEERIILDGNTSLALGTTPTPTLTVSGTGGTIPTQTESVICVALTGDGYRRATVVGGIVAGITRTNADASTDAFGGGAAQKSANATIAITLGQNLFAKVVPVRGAVAYAWFIGTAGNETLAAITTVAEAKFTAVAAGTQTITAAAAGADNSTNALVFDGIVTQSHISGAGYYNALATVGDGVGTGLTPDGVGGIVEIDLALKWFWDNYRLSPTYMLVNAQELANMSKKVLLNGSTPIVRWDFDKNNPGSMIGGSVIGGYLNRYQMGSNPVVKIMLHPDVPPGEIVFVTNDLPYPAADIPGVFQIKTRQDYYQIEWPVKTRKYEFGVYYDGVLQCFAPFAVGVITNIANT